MQVADVRSSDEDDFGDLTFQMPNVKEKKVTKKKKVKKQLSKKEVGFFFTITSFRQRLPSRGFHTATFCKLRARSAVHIFIQNKFNANLVQ